MSPSFQNGSGGTTVTTSIAHGLSDNNVVSITGTTYYDGAYPIDTASGVVFDIPVPWGGADSGTGKQDEVRLSQVFVSSTPIGVVFADDSINY